MFLDQSELVMSGGFVLAVLVLLSVFFGCSAAKSVFTAVTFFDGHSEVVKYDIKSGTATTMYKYKNGEENHGGGAVGLTVSNTSVIWGDSTTGSIMSVPVEGTGGTAAATLISGLVEPQGVALDDETNRVFFIDNRKPTQKIFSMNTDGTDILDLPLDSNSRVLQGACGLAVSNRKLYVGSDIGLAVVDISTLYESPKSSHSSAALRPLPDFTMLVTDVKYVQGIVVLPASSLPPHPPTVPVSSPTTPAATAPPVVFFTSFFGKDGYAVYRCNALDGSGLVGVAEHPGGFSTFMLAADTQPEAKQGEGSGGVTLYWIRDSDTPYMSELKTADATAVEGNSTLVTQIRGSAYGIAVV